MVSSRVHDALYAPNQVVQSLWKTSQEASPRQDISKLIDDFPGAVESHFRAVVNSESSLKEIRSPRTRHALESTPEGTLVRMRLMVQDNSISPEIYLAQQPNGLPGGWAIEHSQSPMVEVDEPHPSSSENVDYAKLRERHVLWAVQVPGESSWPSELLDGDTGSDVEATISHEPFFGDYKSPNGELGLQLKIYGQAPKLCPTDVATFVGILDREPYVGSQSHDSPLIPTLHVVYWQPNPVTLLQESEFPASNPAVNEVDEWPTMIDMIAEALGGDLDAAKLVVLCAVSGGRDAKSPTNSPISVSLTGFPAAPTPSAVPTIVAILRELLPLVSHIPLTLDFLNTTSIAPYSEPSKEDLSAGRLQLPSGSLVIFDERVEEGKLIERGIVNQFPCVENVRAIQDVLSRQTLAYRFPYSSFDFKTNISSIVVTEGKREALFAKTDLCIPVRPRSDSNLYAPLPPSDKLLALRRLMFRIKTGNQTGLKAAPALTEHIQEMFVRDRQAERASGGRKDEISAADEYGLRMRLSKTMALALGLSEITCEAFDMVADLDKRRIQRLKELPLGSGPAP
ncbi:hypothetical protein RhiJN_17519 [Ceratobasidium sp. AG-Ba]|nr:hypothetical protein RhiJN_17519 [Ceratobasidium sp. AG-Ba]